MRSMMKNYIKISIVPLCALFLAGCGASYGKVIKNEPVSKVL